MAPSLSQRLKIESVRTTHKHLKNPIAILQSRCRARQRHGFRPVHGGGEPRYHSSVALTPLRPRRADDGRITTHLWQIVPRGPSSSRRPGETR